MEMQRKHAPSGQHSHQQQLQNQLRVGAPSGPPNFYMQHPYPPQYHATGGHYQNMDNTGSQMLQVRAKVMKNSLAF